MIVREIIKIILNLRLALTSAVLSQTDTSSETEEELIVTPTPRHHNHSLHAKEYHCICECPRRPENSGRVTLRSRSLSPTRRPKSATPSVRPPFKAGKADERIISRRQFLNPGRSRPRSRAIPLEGDPGKNGPFNARDAYSIQINYASALLCIWVKNGMNYQRHYIQTVRRVLVYLLK